MFNSFTIKSADLKRLCLTTRVAVDDEPSKSYALNGVQLEFNDIGDQLLAISSDGRVLARGRSYVNDADEKLKGYKLLIDMEPLFKMQGKLPKRSGCDVTCMVADDGLRATWNNKGVQQVHCKPIEGRFPNWRQIFQSDPFTDYKLDGKKWIEIWNSFVDHVTWSACKLHFGEKVCVSSHIFNGYKWPEFPFLEGSDNNVKLNINMDLLLPILKVLKDRPIEMRYFGEQKPLEFYDPDEKSAFILMPMGEIK